MLKCCYSFFKILSVPSISGYVSMEPGDYTPVRIRASSVFVCAYWLPNTLLRKSCRERNLDVSGLPFFQGIWVTHGLDDGTSNRIMRAASMNG